MKAVAAYSPTLAQAKVVYKAVEHVKAADPLEADEHGLPGGTLPFADGGSTLVFAVEIPRLPGLDGLTIRRARFRVRGRRANLPPVVVTSPANAAAPTGAATGALSTVRLFNLQLTEVPGSGATLVASNAKKLRWTTGGSGIQRASATGSGAEAVGVKQLHLLVRSGQAPNAFGPPVAAAPSFDMPRDPSGMYGPVLAAATLTLESPDAGNLLLRLDPPVSGPHAQVVVGYTDGPLPTSGLPNEATLGRWRADRLEAVWATAPADVELEATCGPAGPVFLGAFPGELGGQPIDLDITPALRGLTEAAYAVADATGPLHIAVKATAKTAGDLVIDGVAVAARYHHSATAGAERGAVLRGVPERITLDVPPALAPVAFTMTFDGRFGPNMLVCGSDGPPPPGVRRGARVTVGHRAARRIVLAPAERNLPLVRVGLFGRASAPTEIVVTLHRDAGRGIGERIGVPVALVVEPSVEPAWLRTELVDDPALRPNPAAVWIVVQGTRGVFWWYAHANADGDSLTSPDDGGTWSAGRQRPLVQLHKRTPDTEPAPLALHWTQGLLAPDILQMPAARTHIETTGVQAAGAGLVAAHAPPATATLEARAEPAPGGGSEVTFRKETVAILSSTQLPMLADLGGHLHLQLSCDRDADVRVVDAALTYDPWAAAR